MQTTTMPDDAALTEARVLILHRMVNDPEWEGPEWQREGIRRVAAALRARDVRITDLTEEVARMAEVLAAARELSRDLDEWQRLPRITNSAEGIIGTVTVPINPDASNIRRLRDALAATAELQA